MLCLRQLFSWGSCFTCSKCKIIDGKDVSSGNQLLLYSVTWLPHQKEQHCWNQNVFWHLLCRTKHITETSIIFVTVMFVYLSLCLIVALCIVVAPPFHLQEAALYRGSMLLSFERFLFYFILHVWPSQVLVIDKLCTFISLIILFYISIYVFCICEHTTWEHFLHLLGTLIDTQSIFQNPFFSLHSEWLLSALGLFPPSVWPILPSTLRQVFLKRIKVSVVYLWFYTWSTQKKINNFFM